MLSQNSSPLRTSPGDTGRQTPEISETIATKVKKKIHEATEEITSKIFSQVEKKKTF